MIIAGGVADFMCNLFQPNMSASFSKHLSNVTSFCLCDFLHSDYWDRELVELAVRSADPVPRIHRPRTNDGIVWCSEFYDRVPCHVLRNSREHPPMYGLGSRESVMATK